MHKGVFFDVSEDVLTSWQARHFVTFHVCEVRDPREAEVAVPMGTETCLFQRVTRCAHVVCDRRGTL